MYLLITGEIYYWRCSKKIGLALEATRKRLKDYMTELKYKYYNKIDTDKERL